MARMYLLEEEVNKSVAHMEVGGKYFQVLNEAGDDWDEELTQALYQSHVDNNLVGKVKNWFTNIFGSRE